MIRVVDDRGVRLTLAGPPARLVSLVPSTTETVFALGAGDRLVGVTRFCVHPEEAQRLPKVGGTKDADAERIRALAPDLVLANCEENTREIFEELERFVPVYAAFPRTVDGAVADLARLSYVLGVDPSPVIDPILAARAAFRAPPPLRALYLIWREPWMAAGPDTFISDMLAQAGLVNALPKDQARFPTLSAEQIRALAPDVVLLPSEPFPFGARHLTELVSLTGISESRFHLMDGEACSWHGARMAHGLRELAALRARIAERR